ncbi:glycosyltransferase [Litoribacter ruber]|uniref:glycosyltransferase family 2 protein n=1 Tax=Litoribacter ruber TaxID=702568 RepID=UPI001BD97E71|nr:glycosyltransferase [Litoribacter ruber]MBT0811352.1 glycosyltransferase [Litoribacter ruber]
METRHLSNVQVSVIITCYNHGKFLKQAVQSALEQNIEELEILVVDDGSLDDTSEVAKLLPVRYIYQYNQGLSAARNTGIRHSRGKFLAFLDADDYFKPNSLHTNLDIIQNNPQIAFVAGSHEKVYEETGEVFVLNDTVNENHFYYMLQGNFIGMHAAVLYNKWVFAEYKFDVNLKMCEDYDLYLKITRKYEIIHHEKIIAAYRIHLSNMSSNYSKMLKAALSVLNRNKPLIKSVEEKKAFKEGVNFWKKYYTQEMINQMRLGRIKLDYYGLFMLIDQSPKILRRSIEAKFRSNLSVD